jgi:hypothetical protein
LPPLIFVIACGVTRTLGRGIIHSACQSIAETVVNVLFMEDDPMNRRVVKDMLDVAGVTMVEAESAERGLKILDEQDFTMVLDGPDHRRHRGQRARLARTLPSGGRGRRDLQACCNGCAV